MARSGQGAVVGALVERHGRTYAEELRIDIAGETPSALFRLLCAALLMSARIRAPIAVEAARALSRAGWRSARSLAGSTWQQRVDAVHGAGYARYDERTATMLGEVADLALERYGGDLRRLRAAADRDPGTERTLLKEFKGVGDVGVDIFFREAQVAWTELRPFADRRALDAAQQLGLPRDPAMLQRLAGGGDRVATLVAALVRAELAGDHEEIMQAARVAH